LSITSSSGSLEERSSSTSSKFRLRVAMRGDAQTRRTNRIRTFDSNHCLKSEWSASRVLSLLPLIFHILYISSSFSRAAREVVA
jgi:hypothetical protein